MVMRWEKGRKKAVPMNSSVREYDLTLRVMKSAQVFNVYDNDNLVVASSRGIADATSAAMHLARSAQAAGLRAIVCVLQSDGQFRVEWSS